MILNFCYINFFLNLLNLIWLLFIWRKSKIYQPHETFFSKIRWNRLDGLESSNKNLTSRCSLLNETCLFSTSACTHWAPKCSRENFSRNLKQNSSLSVLKTQQPETVWLWISKYSNHGQSLYVKLEPLSLISWSKNSIQG